MGSLISNHVDAYYVLFGVFCSRYCFRYLGVFCCDINQSCRLLHTATHGSHFVYEDVLLGFILVSLKV